MARTKQTENVPINPTGEETVPPDVAVQDDGRDAVKDIPPYNPFNEPVADAYPEGHDAEITQATRKPSETIVEHPLSPTDSNPNPHGTRSQQGVSVPIKDKDGNVHVERADEGEGTVEITGDSDEPVHLGDGRTLAKGDKAKVTPEIAKQLTASKQAKRG